MATIHHHIGPADRGRVMNLEEFRDAEEEEGYRYELAQGVLEVTEVPGDAHRKVVSRLYSLMARYQADHPGVVEAFGGGAEFRLWIPGMSWGRNPDLGVVLSGASPDTRGRTQPQLVAEVVSASSRSRDYEVKRQEYLIFGLQEYWIVDPLRETVTVLCRAAEGWAERVIQGQQKIESRLLPGLAWRVAELWVGLPPQAGGDDESS